MAGDVVRACSAWVSLCVVPELSDSDSNESLLRRILSLRDLLTPVLRPQTRYVFALLIIYRSPAGQNRAPNHTDLQRAQMSCHSLIFACFAMEITLVGDSTQVDLNS